MYNSLLTTDRVLSLGARMGVLAVGTMAISLGVNLAHLDTNAAQAATDFVHGAWVFNDLALPTAAPQTMAAGPTSGLSEDVGIKYATEIFGAGGGTELPKGATTLPTVVYTADTSISFPEKFRIIFRLNNAAKFVNMLAYSDGVPPLAVAGTGFGSITDGPPANGNDTKGGAGRNFAKFDVTSSTPGTTISGLIATLSYQISALALATSEQKIEMTMQITDVGELETYPMVERTIVLATSTQGTTASIEPFTTAQTDYRVSVVSGGLEFNDATGIPSEAKIGTLTVKNANDSLTSATVTDDYPKIVFCPDGVNPWRIGVGCALVGSGTGTVAASSLVITGGQFAASTAAPGGVRIANLQQATDDETLNFVLKTTDFATITEQGTDKYNGVVPITIVADGKAPINVPENPPVAELTLSYNDTTFQKIVVPAIEMPRIKADGVRCTIYNVPAPGLADIFAVRITNTSGVAGVVNATLYNGDGSEAFTGTLNDGNAIKAKQTLALFGDNLVALGSWTGRGVLVLSSELPKLEVLGLLRESGNNSAPLTNLSTGATGSGCSY